MKKFFFLMIAVLGMACAFASCSSNDDDDQSSLLFGTWISNDHNLNDTITFSKGGMLVEHAGSQDGMRLMYSSGNYSLKSNQLIVNWTSEKKWNKNEKKWELVTDPEETDTITIELKGNIMKFVAMEGEQDYKPSVFRKQ